jgi:peptidoglycan lytic transglycosylase
MISRASRAAAIVAALLLAACSSSRNAAQYSGGHYGPGHPHYVLGPPYQVNGVWYYPRVDYDYDQTGTASWYGPQYDGRATSDGEIFDMNAVSAAHTTLPLPSVVRVTNLRNGRELELRVNDRGPFVDNRIIDVSRRAAQLLGFERQGTAPVRVKIEKEESVRVAELAKRGLIGGATVFAAATPARAPATRKPVVVAGPVVDRAAQHPAPRPVEMAAAPAPQPAPPPRHRSFALIPEAEAAPMREARRPPAPVAGGIFIQAGAFAVRDNAERVEARIASLGAVRIMAASVNGTEIYRVRLGPVTSLEEANRLLARIVGRGYTGAQIIAD